jgi:hypothetical protein
MRTIRSKPIVYVKRPQPRRQYQEPIPRDGEEGDDNGEPSPSFDAFRRLTMKGGYREAMKEAKKIDSSVDDALGEFVGTGQLEEEDLESIDAYFKGVWMKHHGG